MKLWKNVSGTIENQNIRKLEGHEKKSNTSLDMQIDYKQ